MNPGIDETPRAVLDRPARGVFAPVKVHPDSQIRQLAATTPLSSIRSRKPSFVGALAQRELRAENRPESRPQFTLGAVWPHPVNVICAGGRWRVANPSGAGPPSTPRRGQLISGYASATAPAMGCGRTRRISPNTRMPSCRAHLLKEGLRHLWASPLIVETSP